MDFLKNIRLCWKVISLWIVENVEKFFFKLGKIVAESPWHTITICWVFVALSVCGLFKFYQEKNPLKLWIPQDTDFAHDTQWLVDKFGVGLRTETILVTSENVLEPKILAQLADISHKVNNLEVIFENETISWKNHCLKVPVISFYASGLRFKRSVSNESLEESFDFGGDFFNKNNDADENLDKKREFDPSVDIDTDTYCAIIKGFKLDCYQLNVLDFWGYNSSKVDELTLDSVIDDLNKTERSPSLGHLMNFSSTLGGIEKNDDGKIVSASAMKMVWMVQVNFSNVDMEKVGNKAGTQEWVSESILAWENSFLQLMASVENNVSNMSLYYSAGKSFADISESTMFQDVDKLIIGIILMVIYIQIILSKFNWVEFRFSLGNAGLLCVGMAFIVGCGWCSIMGIPYGPVHTSLPFLLMGLGVDDMFIMKACWDQLSESERSFPLSVQIGLMLKHAGASIVVTSITDIVAFMIGAITILPSLQSFCIYAAVGVFFILCFSVTFYVACVTLDVRRIQQKRNGLLLCVKHDSYVQKPPESTIFQKVTTFIYSKVIFSIPSKVIIISFTVAMVGFSIEAVLQLRQKFDPIWFIPEYTYFYKFTKENQAFYPDSGFKASVYMGQLNYTLELPSIYNMSETLSTRTDIISRIDSWTEPFRLYIINNLKKDISHDILSEHEWRLYISKFLFSPNGAKYQANFRFSRELECGIPAADTIISIIDFQFRRFSDSSEYLPAMHDTKNIVKSANLTSGDGFSSVWSMVFANWVTDEVIGMEVFRNVELALLCVMICTIVLISNLQMCFWIFLCVLFTLINVCGWMHRWGLTIDIVSCIGLELAVGLCVDYAAHVGHTFLTITEGSRQDRSLATITSIGTAVLHGGGSTLLALSMLSMSATYTFKAFFKIFLLVIGFGLFHGLIFLPVLLSLVGPSPYDYSNSKDKKHYKGHLGHQRELSSKAPFEDVPLKPISSD